MKVVNVGSIADLRKLLQEADDEDFAGFINAYALGDIASRLINAMSPDGRAGFFASMRQLYPECVSPRVMQ